MFSGLIQRQEAAIPPQEEIRTPNLRVDPCLVLTADPKPRLRWTADLHDRFVDAVTQLGGPDRNETRRPESLSNMEMNGFDDKTSAKAKEIDLSDDGSSSS